MLVRVTKIQDLRAATRDKMPKQQYDPDKSGPISARAQKQHWSGELRKFTGWFGDYILHDLAPSLEYAFRSPGSRIILRGEQDLVSGPIATYKVYSSDRRTENSAQGVIEMSVEESALVRTLNSVYEVMIITSREKRQERKPEMQAPKNEDDFSDC